MTLRTRLALPSVALFVAATTAACGSGGAPTDASPKAFCDAQGSLMSDIAASADKMPKPEDLAKSIQSWADKIEEVGTPDDMSEEARAGFEATIDQARDIEADDLKADNLDNLGEELSGDAKKEAEAFTSYVGEKCGNLLNDIQLPEVPDTTQ